MRNRILTFFSLYDDQVHAYAISRFWQNVFQCNLMSDAGYSEACETDQTLEGSGYILSDTFLYAMKSAQVVAAINDFIEEKYCEVSADTPFQVRWDLWFAFEIQSYASLLHGQTIPHQFSVSGSILIDSRH